MKIQTEPLEDHQVKITVEFEPEVLQTAKRKAARKIARKTKIPGFRPGKAPYGVIVKHVGEAAILDDAIEDIVNEQYPKIIKETKIDPYGAGSLENVASLEPLKLEFIVPLNAEVTLGDYKSLRIPYKPKKITKKDVDAAIESLRQQNAVVKTVEREAKKGDIVHVTLNSKPVNPEVTIDEKSLFNDYHTSILIPTDDDDSKEEVPFPGFATSLIGVKANEEKTITHTFSDDYPIEDLRGKEIEFHIKINAIQSMELPELNDEFAQSLGDFKTMAEFKKHIKENLTNQANEEYQKKYDEDILDKIIADAEIKFPPQMLEREMEDFKHGLAQRLSQQGLSIDLYKQYRGVSDEEFEQEIKDASEIRLKQSLVIFKIAELEGIEVNQEQVKEETTRALNYFSQTLSPKDAKRINTNELLPNIYTNVMMDHLTMNTLEWLRKLAKGELETATENDDENQDSENSEETKQAEKAKSATKKVAKKKSASKKAKTKEPSDNEQEKQDKDE